MLYHCTDFSSVDPDASIAPGNSDASVSSVLSVSAVTSGGHISFSQRVCTWVESVSTGANGASSASVTWIDSVAEEAS